MKPIEKRIQRLERAYWPESMPESNTGLVTMEEFLFIWGIQKKWPGEAAVPSFARGEYCQIWRRNRSAAKPQDLVVGFMLGCCSIIGSQKSATILGMTAPLLALAIPLLDTALAIIRSFRGKPIFTADHGHIHHRLLDQGLTPRRVALIIYGSCGLCASLAVLMMNNGFEGLVILLFCVAAWIGIQHLGYVEFGVAGRMFVEGAFRRHLNTNVALKVLQERLSKAATPDDCWTVIQDSAKDFGFHTVEMSLAGRAYQYRNGGCPERSWVVRIPLSSVDFVELTREFDTPAEHSVVVPYADTVRRTTEAKLVSFPN